MGEASGGCQGRGETGAGAAAAVATGKRGSGEGGAGRDDITQRGGWLEKKKGSITKIENKQEKVKKNKAEGRRKKGVVLGKREVGGIGERDEVE